MFKWRKKKQLESILSQSPTTTINEVVNHSLEKEIFPANTKILSEDDNLTETLLEYEVNTYEQVAMIADRLISGENLIINLADLKKTDWSKVLNFLSGVVYALNGKAQKISSQSYVFIVNDKNSLHSNK